MCLALIFGGLVGERTDHIGRKTKAKLQVCSGFKVPRSHHCRKCGRCVKKMDHHCPWINNCVGEWNQKYFLQFLFYVGVLAAYSILLVALSWSAECPQCPKDIMSKQGSTDEGHATRY